MELVFTRPKFPASILELCVPGKRPQSSDTGQPVQFQLQVEARSPGVPSRFETERRATARRRQQQARVFEAGKALEHLAVAQAVDARA